MLRFPITMKTLPSRRSKRHSMVCLTATAALSSCAQAWVLPTASHSLYPRPTAYCLDPSNQQLLINRLPTRMYASGRNQDDDSILTKVGKAVKSVLPTKWFGNEEEKAKLARKKEIKNQVKGGLDQALKDAPLGIRMIGKMMGPLVSGVMSNVNEMMEESRKTQESVYADAQSYLQNDPAVTQILGEPISLGSAVSQSSSTVNINGRTQSRTDLILPVTGPRGSGMARLSATQDGISQLQVEAGGRVINVSLMTSPRSSFSSRSSINQKRRDDDDIIEAEIIDKETK